MKNPKNLIAIALLATVAINVSAGAYFEIDQYTINVAIKTDANPTYSTYMTCFTKKLTSEATSDGFFKIEINGLYGCGRSKPLPQDTINLITRPAYGVLVYTDGDFRKSFGITYSSGTLSAEIQEYNFAITDNRGGQYANY